MSRLVTNAIRSTAASSDAMTIDSAGKPSFPNGGVGKILKVENMVKTDPVSLQMSATYADVSGFTISMYISPTTSVLSVLIAS